MYLFPHWRYFYEKNILENILKLAMDSALDFLDHPTTVFCGYYYITIAHAQKFDRARRVYY